MIITFTYNNETGIFDENTFGEDADEILEYAFEFLYNNLGRHNFNDDVPCVIVDDVLHYDAFGKTGAVDLMNY